MSRTDSTNSTAHRCSKARPCNRWRDCHFCARRRQAKIADAVEKLAGRTGPLRWSILYPLQGGSAAAKEARADWLAEAAPAGAIWTIEQSRKTGALHCNIITPAHCQANPSSAHTWTQTITGNPRHVGAYIAKRQQMPTREQFDGRLYGTAGPLWQWLAGSQSEPIVAAAAAQHIINREAMLMESIHQIERQQERDRIALLNPGQLQREQWAREEAAAKTTTEKTRDEYRAIAARYLPDILAQCVNK